MDGAKHLSGLQVEEIRTPVSYSFGLISLLAKMSNISSTKQ